MDSIRKKIGLFRFSLIILLGLIWMAVLYHVPVMLNIASIRFAPPLSTSFMRYNAFFHPLQKQRYKWVNADQISDYLKKAVVIAEDDQFFRHNGLDWKAIQIAAKKDWKRKSLDFGGSTITQQLVKNLYLYPAKDPVRKLREALLALIIDAYMPKERILELYLNVVQFGPGIYGAEAAAKFYFKTSAKNLGAGQSAFLASILPSPVKNGKRGYHLTRRAQSILRRIQ